MNGILERFPQFRRNFIKPALTEPAQKQTYRLTPSGKTLYVTSSEGKLTTRSMGKCRFTVRCKNHDLGPTEGLRQENMTRNIGEVSEPS